MLRAPEDISSEEGGLLEPRCRARSPGQHVHVPGHTVACLNCCLGLSGVGIKSSPGA